MITAAPVKWFYEGLEVRTGTAYALGETVKILGRFIAMHPDTADEMREAGLFEAVTVH